MKKVAFRNLGCKVNEYEMEYMQQIMSENGYLIVPFDTKADIYVINTCTVTNIADRKSRQMLHQAKKRNPDSIVVAAGCYVQTGKEEVLKDISVDIVLGNNKKSLLPKIIEEYMNSHKIRNDLVPDLTVPSDYENMCIEKTAEHARAFIKIQDGCDQFCSFCAIPLSRGRIRSRKCEDTIKELELLSKNGYTEVVITGIHLSSYGVDFHRDENGKMTSYNELAKNGYTNEDLLKVLEEAAKIEGIKRIRLGSLEPRLITEDFLKRLSKIDKICPHFHLSLQSGCDATLKRMNRKYTKSEFMEGVELLRKYFDKPAITTDVIVGFPGETEEEFNESFEFYKKVHFADMHVFKYSKRKNTVAASLKDQVSVHLKDERSEKVIELANKMTKEYHNELIGRKVEVLFEEVKDGYFVGHTREYVLVGLKTDEDLKGVIKTLTLDADTLCFMPK